MEYGPSFEETLRYVAKDLDTRNQVRYSKNLDIKGERILCKSLKAEGGNKFKDYLTYQATVLEVWQRDEYAKRFSPKDRKEFKKISKKVDDEIEFVVKELSPLEIGQYMGWLPPEGGRKAHRLLEKTRYLKPSEERLVIRGLIQTQGAPGGIHYILDIDRNAPPIMGTARELRYANMKCLNINEIMGQF